MNEEENKVEVTGDVKTEDSVVEATPVKDKKEVDVKDLIEIVKKNIKWIALAVIALILIIIIASCASNSGSAFTLVEKDSTYGKLDSETLINIKGEEITVDEEISSVAYSADKSLTVVKDKEGTLFVVDGTDLVEVASEVDYYVVSLYGDSIAYLTDVEELVGTLHLYNVAKESDVEIDDDVYAGDLILSADGKSVAYINDCEVEETWFGGYEFISGDVYVSKNGKEGEEVSKDAIPLALTDGGKHVYYIKDGEKLYMNDNKLSSKIKERVYFNQDYTEIIFNEESSVQYFTVKMKEPVKVKKGTFSSIYAPDNMVSYVSYVNDMNYSMQYNGVDTFDEKLWRIDYSEAYFVFDKGEETEKLSSYLVVYQMSPNGKSMLYQDGSDLILIKNIAKSREGEEVANTLKNSDSFVASEDLKDIYYYDEEDDELCYVKKGEGVHIADDAAQYVYSDKYGVVYFIEDDELFYAGKTAKSKEKVCGEEVRSIFVSNEEVYFVFKEDDVYSIMKLTGKAKYESVFDFDEEALWNIDFGDLF